MSKTNAPIERMLRLRESTVNELLDCIDNATHTRRTFREVRQLVERVMAEAAHAAPTNPPEGDHDK